MTIQEKKEQILKYVTELAQSVAQPLGLAVLDVRLTQQGHRASLEVCIFKKGGLVSLSDCEHVSRTLDSLLEQESLKRGPILTGSFLLEVVSPGIDRQLSSSREFEIFAGQQVRIKAKNNIGDLGSDFTCTLLGGDVDTVAVRDGKAFVDPNQRKRGNLSKRKGGERPTNGATFKIELNKIYKVNLYSADLKSVR